ncbi:DUF493 family protein [Marinigracilibium pacificum]|uniref:DUF493 domain-containing protein n=1 Tax=Marinigracilibium pacificum TaxID=2729599 RepID=A0A848J0L6_9BACT|nr:DUF493 family protein [Marinigracilibium pacificum]NMM46792.1 DUF493 domain-containing protein [Marinigracilibium pacificum]
MATQKELDIQKFKDQLDASYQWPALYKYKFIVPSDKIDEVKALFPKSEVVIKPSKKGNYASLTADIMSPSSDDIIKVYLKASEIEGIISL